MYESKKIIFVGTGAGITAIGLCLLSMALKKKTNSSKDKAKIVVTKTKYKHGKKYMPILFTIPEADESSEQNGGGKIRCLKKNWLMLLAWLFVISGIVMMLYGIGVI